jgi:hypothetical protein
MPSRWRLRLPGSEVHHLLPVAADVEALPKQTARRSGKFHVHSEISCSRPMRSCNQTLIGKLRKETWYNMKSRRGFELQMRTVCQLNMPMLVHISAAHLHWLRLGFVYCRFPNMTFLYYQCYPSILEQIRVISPKFISGTGRLSDVDIMFALTELKPGHECVICRFVSCNLIGD